MKLLEIIRLEYLSFETITTTLLVIFTVYYVYYERNAVFVVCTKLLSWGRVGEITLYQFEWSLEDGKSV